MPEAISKFRSKRARRAARAAELESLVHPDLGSRIRRNWITALLAAFAWGIPMTLMPVSVTRIGDFIAGALLMGICVPALAIPTLMPACSARRLPARRQLTMIFAAALVSALPLALPLLASRFPGYLAEYYLGVCSLMLPCILAPMIGTILAGRAAGASLGAWAAAATAVVCAMDMTRGAACLVTALCAVWWSSRIRTRASVFTAAMLAAATATVVHAITLADYILPEGAILPAAVPMVAVCTVFNGLIVLCTVLAVMSLCESVFHVTTGIMLLEMSDLGHPLLQRLALEAPGTYHHSQVVANLAESAAIEVGADPMLARVSAYFHDIGKLTKPAYYAENMQQGPNPHDDLQPSMSALIVTAHVKEGLGLAVAHKVPEAIRHAIEQHHGTSLVSYFHGKALRLEKEQVAEPEGGGVRDSDFRYAGPKPATRETAILMIADAVEAASRSLHKTSPQGLEEIISSVVAVRIADGQLDDCGLTLDDLAAIKRSLLFSLSTMFHRRVAYPGSASENIDEA